MWGVSAKVLELGVIGSDDRAAALVERLGNESPFTLGPVQLAAPAREQTVNAVFVGGAPSGRAAAAAAALGAGRSVLCPMPCALTEAELDQLERTCEGTPEPGLLYTPTDLRHMAAVGHALDAMAGGGIGPGLHAYVGYRTRVGAAAGGERQVGSSVLEDPIWHVLDFALGCTPAPMARVHAAGGRLFGGGVGTGGLAGETRRAAVESMDTLVLTIRFTDDFIVSAEISACLPADYPSEGPDIDIDIVGRRGALRVEPGRQVVTVVGAGGRTSVRDWHPHPVVSMVRTFGDLVNSTAGAEARLRHNRSVFSHHRRVLQAMRSVQEALVS